MKNHQGLLLAVTLSFLGFSSLEPPAHAQIPLGAEIRVNERTELNQGDQQLAVLPDGSFAVVWSDLWDLGGIGYDGYAAARFYAPDGEALTEAVYFVDPPGAERTSGLPRIVARPAGGYSLVAYHYPRQQPIDNLFRTYSATGQALRGMDVTLPDEPGSSVTDLAVAPSGRLVVAWVDFQPAPGRAAWLSPSGQFSAPFFEGMTVGGQSLQFPFLGVDRTGGVVVAGTECLGPQGRDCDVYAQRYNRFGSPLGKTVPVNQRVDGLQAASSIAVAPDGRFLVAWEEHERAFPGNPFAIDALARVFDASGRPLTGELRIGTQRNFSDLNPHVAADPHGNFILVYARFRRENGIYGWDVMGQLIRKDGKRVGLPFRVSTSNTLNEFTHPKVAFGGNGTFVVVWEAFDGDFDGVFGQRFLAAEGEEICAAEGAELRCDGARSGGAPEWTVGLDGGQVVLGDVDRDGKEDACVFARGEFRCDTDHRGLPYETTLRFGQDGDVALWGDVDGDGRGEACVRRGTTISCDTGHNGGRGELDVQVGNAADLPFLGDVNGDRREDACVYQAAGRFACILSGSGKSWAVSFGGRAGDVAALGDFNGDGRADPCVWRQGELLCDTARNGGTPEARLAIPEPGGRLLFANVDGL